VYAAWINTCSAWKLWSRSEGDCLKLVRHNSAKRFSTTAESHGAAHGTSILGQAGKDQSLQIWWWDGWVFEHCSGEKNESRMTEMSIGLRCIIRDASICPWWRVKRGPSHDLYPPLTQQGPSHSKHLDGLFQRCYKLGPSFKTVWVHFHVTCSNHVHDLHPLIAWHNSSCSNPVICLLLYNNTSLQDVSSSIFLPLVGVLTFNSQT